MSKPLDEYMLLYLDGLGLGSSSLLVKLSNNISLAFMRRQFRLPTYFHWCAAPRRTFVVLPRGELEEGN